MGSTSSTCQTDLVYIPVTCVSLGIAIVFIALFAITMSNYKRVSADNPLVLLVKE